MTVAVVPIKGLDAAKTRLSERFSPEQRRELALAMLQDVLRAVSRARGVRDRLVVTREPEVALLGKSSGWEVLTEEAGVSSHTDAVEQAARVLQARGATAMLTIPGDVPGATPEEIDCIVKSGSDADVVLVPSRGGHGTNAALVRPPSSFPLKFGEPSFLPHIERAQMLGLRVLTLSLPGLSLDIDSPDDVEAFMRVPSETVTRRLLTERGYR